PQAEPNYQHYRSERLEKRARHDQAKDYRLPNVVSAETFYSPGIAIGDEIRGQRLTGQDCSKENRFRSRVLVFPAWSTSIRKSTGCLAFPLPTTPSQDD